MRIGAERTTGWRATVSVAMSNYIEAGSIIAIAVSLTLWQKEFGVGRLRRRAARRGQRQRVRRGRRRLIGGGCATGSAASSSTPTTVVYMVGVLLAAFAVDYGMLLAGFVITGLAVGAGVPASWTFIAEQAPARDRAPSLGTAQRLVDRPDGRLRTRDPRGPARAAGSRLIFLHLFVVAGVMWWMRQGLSESTIWDEAQSEDVESPARARGCGPAVPASNVSALLFLFGVYGFWNLVAGQAGIFMPRVYDAAGLRAPPGRTHCRCWCGAARRWRPGSASCGSGTAWTCAGSTPSAPSSGSPPGRCCPYGTPPPVLLASRCSGAPPPASARRRSTACWTSELFATRYRATAQGLLFLRGPVRGRRAATSSRCCSPARACRWSGRCCSASC